MRIYFDEHNKGWNNRSVTMNYEVWLLLLGFNVDYWTPQHVEKAPADFGQLLVWEEDPAHLSRVLVKA